MYIINIIYIYYIKIFDWTVNQKSIFEALGILKLGWDISLKLKIKKKLSFKNIKILSNIINNRKAKYYVT
jgi:hypothetical protein